MSTAPGGVDPVQAVVEGVWKIVNASSSIRTLCNDTGGDRDLFVEQDGSAADGPLPVLTFFVVTAAELPSIGDTRDVLMQVSAVGRSRSLCRRLLHEVEHALTVPAFGALTPPLDAMVVDRTRGTGASPADAEGVVQEDLDLTIRVTIP